MVFSALLFVCFIYLLEMFTVFIILEFHIYKVKKDHIHLPFSPESLLPQLLLPQDAAISISSSPPLSSSSASPLLLFQINVLSSISAAFNAHRWGAQWSLARVAASSPTFLSCSQLPAAPQ